MRSNETHRIYKLSTAAAFKTVEQASKLAVASGEELGKVTGIINKSLIAFGVTMTEDTEITDMFLSSVLNTPLTLEKLGASLNNSASAFKNFIDMSGRSGKELEEYKKQLLATNVALTGGLAKQGVPAGTAGVTMRMMTTKLLAAEKTASKMFDMEMSMNRIMTDGNILTMDKLSAMAKKDLPEAIDLLSELYNKGQISFKTLSKLFTVRHSPKIVALLNDINGNLDEYVEMTTTGRSVTEDFEKSMQSWSSILDKVKNDLIKISIPFQDLFLKNAKNISGFIDMWAKVSDNIYESGDAAKYITSGLMELAITVGSLAFASKFITGGKLLGGLKKVFSPALLTPFALAVTAITVAWGVYAKSVELKIQKIEADTLRMNTNTEAINKNIKAIKKSRKEIKDYTESLNILQEIDIGGEISILGDGQSELFAKAQDALLAIKHTLLDISKMDSLFKDGGRESALADADAYGKKLDAIYTKMTESKAMKVDLERIGQTSKGLENTEDGKATTALYEDLVKDKEKSLDLTRKLIALDKKYNDKNSVGYNYQISLIKDMASNYIEFGEAKIQAQKGASGVVELEDQIKTFKRLAKIAKSTEGIGVFVGITTSKADYESGLAELTAMNKEYYDSLDTYILRADTHIQALYEKTAKSNILNGTYDNLAGLKNALIGVDDEFLNIINTISKDSTLPEDSLIAFFKSSDFKSVATEMREINNATADNNKLLEHQASISKIEFTPGKSKEDIGSYRTELEIQRAQLVAIEAENAAKDKEAITKGDIARVNTQKNMISSIKETIRLMSLQIKNENTLLQLNIMMERIVKRKEREVVLNKALADTSVLKTQQKLNELGKTGMSLLNLKLKHSRELLKLNKSNLNISLEMAKQGASRAGISLINTPTIKGVKGKMKKLEGTVDSDGMTTAVRSKKYKAYEKLLKILYQIQNLGLNQDITEKQSAKETIKLTRDLTTAWRNGNKIGKDSRMAVLDITKEQAKTDLLVARQEGSSLVIQQKKNALASADLAIEKEKANLLKESNKLAYDEIVLNGEKATYYRDTLNSLMGVETKAKDIYESETTRLQAQKKQQNDELDLANEKEDSDEKSNEVKRIGLEISKTNFEIEKANDTLLQSQIDKRIKIVNIMANYGKALLSGDSKFNTSQGMDLGVKSLENLARGKEVDGKDILNYYAAGAGILTEVFNKKFDNDKVMMERELSLIELRGQLDVTETQKLATENAILIKKKELIDLEYKQQTQFAGVSGAGGGFLGGAAQGAMAGMASGNVGVAIGTSILGGIAGLFGADKAKEQAKQQKDDLDEQKAITAELRKRTRLDEQRNTLLEIANNYASNVKSGGTEFAKQQAKESIFKDLKSVTTGEEFNISVNRGQRILTEGYKPLVDASDKYKVAIDAKQKEVILSQNKFDKQVQIYRNNSAYDGMEISTKNFKKLRNLESDTDGLIRAKDKLIVEMNSLSVSTVNLQGEALNLTLEEVDQIKNTIDEIETSKEVFKGYFGFLVEMNAETGELMEKEWTARSDIHQRLMKGDVDFAETMGDDMMASMRNILFKEDDNVNDHLDLLGGSYRDFSASVAHLVKNDALTGFIDKLSTKDSDYLNARADASAQGGGDSFLTNMKSAITNIDLLEADQERLNKTTAQTLGIWVALGGKISDAGDMVSEFGSDISSAMQDMFKEKDFRARFNILGGSLSDILGDSITKKLLDNEFKNDFLKINTMLTEAMGGEGINLSKIAGMAQEVGRITAKTELSALKLDSAMSMLNMTDEINYLREDSQISYAVGSTSENITHNYYTSNINAGNIVSSPESLRELSSQIGQYLREISVGIN